MENEKIILAGGCFWCTEAVFSQLKGVQNVTPGYSGGTVVSPSYQDVCSGTTGHAESVQIIFNPSIISLTNILYVFLKLHDPTTLNKQGADEGTQYRSAIFYYDDKQKEVINKSIIEAQKLYTDKIVTQIGEFKNFFPADPSHKDYYFQHRNTPYCMFVIDPKIQKLKKEFSNLLKTEN